MDLLVKTPVEALRVAKAALATAVKHGAEDPAFPVGEFKELLEAQNDVIIALAVAEAGYDARILREAA